MWNLNKGRGSPSPRDGCFLSAGVCIFNEIAMHTRAPASNRLAKASKASHGSRVSPSITGKGKSKENKRKSKGTSKGTNSSNQGAKGVHRGETLKAGLSGLGGLKSDASFRNLHRRVPLTLPGTMVGTMTRNDGWSFDEWNDDWSSVGWHEVGNKRTTVPQAYFSLAGFGCQCHQ